MSSNLAVSGEANGARAAGHRWKVLGVGFAANASFSAAFSGIPTTAVFLRSGYHHLSNGELGLVLVIDGLDLVTHIRRAWPQFRIVVTTLTNGAILHALLADGEVSVLSKSQSMRDLRVAIEAVRGGDCYIGRTVRKALASPDTSACQSDSIYAADPESLPRLMGRQTEVVRRVVSGESIAKIAATLGCHRTTVMRRKRETMTRLGVTNDPGLFSYVHSHRILNF
ncbi:MAG: Uncharacterized MFS-type transporter [uncultured Paraburkholderia sp.]|nr:MAG: Uncharacterized MFS-type transporter [uncultured Paraburkholderia sp.]CAH2930435.1 MAG: Uncharacterized MFS-type transporter [uncultured Paraburkholderia sp.]